MSTDREHAQADEGRPTTEPDDLVLPSDVESTVTAGTPTDQVDGTASAPGTGTAEDERSTPRTG